MASIHITEIEASIIYALASEVEPEDAVILDKMYRKMSAALTNSKLKNIKMFTGSKVDGMTHKDMPGPLSENQH